MAVKPLRPYTRRQSSHNPFAIPALREYLVLVSSPKHVVEIARSSESVLSFHAAMKERLKHKITMLGFEHNDIDPDEYVTIQVIKMHLRKSLPYMNSVIEHSITKAFADDIVSAADNDVITIINLFTLAKTVVGQVNNRIFFGEELSRNKEFASAAARYPWDGSATAEFCRYLPSFLAPSVYSISFNELRPLTSSSRHVGSLLMAWTGSMKVVGKHLAKLVNERVVAHEEGRSAQFVDITQFVIKTSRTPRQRDQTRMTQLIAAMLFAVSLAVPMALYWAIINLCIHNEYTELLREEIERVEKEGCSSPLKSLRLLDCFLRESARLSPPDALAVQRKAVKPFTFSDGTHIPAGNLVAVPQQAVMRDPHYYVNPDTFDPYRFYSKEQTVSDEAVQRFTDVNMHFPYWGAPTKSCPGRWYASDVLKQVLVHFLKNYDFALVEPANCKPLKLTTALAPRFDVKISLKVRK
ncbi:cytochrome P450 [Xylaria venustula]|nr:cytochrome P450 [Xylaria venustula]